MFLVLRRQGCGEVVEVGAQSVLRGPVYGPPCAPRPRAIRMEGGGSKLRFELRFELQARFTAGSAGGAGCSHGGGK